MENYCIVSCALDSLHYLWLDDNNNSINNSISDNDKMLDRNDSCSRLSIEWSHRGRNHHVIPFAVPFRSITNTIV